MGGVGGRRRSGEGDETRMVEEVDEALLLAVDEADEVDDIDKAGMTEDGGWAVVVAE